MPFIKNIEMGSVCILKEEVNYMPGQIVSKTLAQNTFHSVTLFAFDAGEEISTHTSDGDAMVIILDGTGQITLDGNTHVLSSGETIIMPAKIPHAVYAKEAFKMMLIVLFNTDTKNIEL